MLFLRINSLYFPGMAKYKAKMENKISLESNVLTTLRDESIRTH